MLKINVNNSVTLDTILVVYDRPRDTIHTLIIAVKIYKMQFIYSYINMKPKIMHIITKLVLHGLKFV